LFFIKGNYTKINMTTMLEDTTTQNLNISSVYRSPITIKDIKCGGEHTIVLSTNGRVYTFGHGYTGQLGLGNTKNYERPMIVKSLIKKTVNQIAAGWSHSMILTSQGFLYVAGCGKYGEL
jgi:alpha-tubulin suppressor-like RCC1 family protein